MDETASRAVCSIILGLCFADGELHPGEERFLQRLLARFGLPSDTKVSPIQDHGEAIARLAALSEADRHETLALMVAAAAADGVVHPAERVLIGAVADELGLSQAEVDERLRGALVG